MGFEWDARKATLNLRKHRIDFADAATVSEDERTLTIAEVSSLDEERWITVGMDALGRILVVVYTWRAETIRLISARTATPREQMGYGNTNET